MLISLQAPTVREELAEIEKDRAAQVQAAAVASSALAPRDMVDFGSRMLTAHFDALEKLRNYDRQVQDVARQVYQTDLEREEKRVWDYDRDVARREDELEGMKDHVVRRIRELDAREKDL